MRHKLSLVAFILLTFSGTALFAQTNDEGLAFLQFNFLNPGARALAMGGAFVGMADDATAALANPAGLTALIRPEASLEFSLSDYDNSIPWTSGQFRSEASLVGCRNANLDPIDCGSAQAVFLELNYGNAVFDLQEQSFPTTVGNISFASFVYPVQPGRFVVSGFYNSQTKFEREFQTQGLDSIVEFPGGDIFTLEDALFPTTNALDLSLSNFGFSASFQPVDIASFGLSIGYSAFDVQSETQRFPPAGFENFRNTERLDGDDSGLSLTLGTLFRFQPLRIGAAYTRRPEFDATATYEFINLFTGVPASVVTERKFKIPDSFSIGFSVQPTDQFSVNFDIVRIQYSQLQDNYYSAFFIPGSTAATNLENFQRNVLEVEDGTEVRLGGEYVMPMGDLQLSLRGGYWREPFHSVIFNVEDAELQQRTLVFFDAQGNPNEVFFGDNILEPFHLRSFNEGSNHITFGGGVVFKQFSVDAGFDLSDNFNRFVLSTVLNVGQMFD